MGQINYSRNITDKELLEERLEELRMLSGLKIKEIHRLRAVFLKLALEGNSTRSVDLLNKEVDIKLRKDIFLSIPCVSLNPLSERIAKCFGFEEDVESLDFQTFLCGIAAFNSPGHKEQKLHLLFRIQDMDDDGVLSKSDLSKYINLVTGDNLEEDEIKEIINEVFNEIGSAKENTNKNIDKVDDENNDDELEQEETSDKEKDSVITFADYRRVVATLDFQAKLFLPI